MSGGQGAHGHSPTLTFLFTDIEAHSELWDTRPDAMSEALREHDELIASVVSDVGGTVVKNEGDGAMAVFTDASRAVEAAVSIQRAMTAREWPGIGRLRLRMGLNTGVADTRDGDYFGPEVIRAARMCAAAHGGQIVATRAVVELARRVSWVDLGRHRLRGFAAPIEIHQVVADGLGARFPALRTLDALPNTLPRFRTEFFGRDDEIAEIGELLSTHRLVTLTGVGGSGKTRLAVEVAHDQLGGFPDGVFFADLAVVTESQRVASAIARGLELDVGGSPGQMEPPAERVARFLSTRSALLVLDNCEHLLDAAAETVDRLLDVTRDLRLLVTSREGLHVEGEHMVQVPSLPLDTHAVRLFRACAAASGARDVDEETARRICERLDGLPLAIELAAARAGQLGVGEVARRLSDRFQLLTGSQRRVPRQRTLEATLDWSHDHLSEDEQRALRRLAVFSGTFSLRAAERVSSAPASVIGSLVDKSLVQRAEDDRFRLLETVRAYAENRLLAAGDARSARQALAEWLLDEIDSFSDEEVILATTTRSDEFVAAELENLLAAMAWASSTDDWETVARLASYAGFAEGLIGQDSFRPVARYICECLDHGIEGELRGRTLAAFTATRYLEPEDERVDLWSEAAQQAWRGTDGPAVMALAYVANVLDARSRAIGDESGVQQAARSIERSLRISHDLDPRWEVLPTVFGVVLALNASEWKRAAERAGALTTLRQRDVVGRMSAWVLWIEAVAQLAIGSPLERGELERRLLNVRRRDPGLAADVHIAALSAPDPARPRGPILLDRRVLDGSTRADAAAVLISVAALAARERDWPMAARSLAAGRGDGGIFSSPAGVALYRLTAPAVRAALDKPVRDALIVEARDRGLAHAIDAAAEWLAMGDQPL